MLKLTQPSGRPTYISVGSIDVIMAQSTGCYVYANGDAFCVNESADQVLAMLEAALEDDDPDATRQ